MKAGKLFILVIFHSWKRMHTLIYLMSLYTTHCVAHCTYWELLLTNKHCFFFSSKLYHAKKWCAKFVRNIVRTIVSFSHNQFSQEPLDDGEGLNERESQTIRSLFFVCFLNVASTADTFMRLCSLIINSEICISVGVPQGNLQLHLYSQIYQLTFKVPSNLRLIKLVHCRCSRRTLYKGPDNHTAWSWDKD